MRTEQRRGGENAVSVATFALDRTLHRVNTSPELGTQPADLGPRFAFPSTCFFHGLSTESMSTR
mgnify:CR=1 FL=1